MPDIFISYAHEDKKWAEAFEQDLQARLGPNVDIYRDNRILVGMHIDGHLMEKVRNSAVFVPVISPNWLGSAYCQKELREFVASGESTRILCAEMLPVGELPEPLPSIRRQVFYGGDPATKLRRDSKKYEEGVARIAEAFVQLVKDCPEPQINGLVKEIREQAKPHIEHRCGTMKILTMTQPIEVGGIYTDINILERPLASRRRSIEEILADIQPSALDRLGIAQAKERVPALDAVVRHARLMVMGKPGAGKTTLLKRLAMECIHGRHRPHLVPVYVPLRELMERPEKETLGQYIRDQWNGHPHTERVLRAGRALLLLDGLDEVLTADQPRVRRAVDEFPACPTVVTCRIAAQEYVFEHFAEVEVADGRADAHAGHHDGTGAHGSCGELAVRDARAVGVADDDVRRAGDRARERDRAGRHRGDHGAG